MTIDEAKKMAEAKLQCMERDVSGKDDDCNNQRCYECSLNYEQGNMGEQKEWLRMSIKALELQQDYNKGFEDCRQAVINTIFAECSGTKLDIDFAKVLLLRRAIKSLSPGKSE